MTAAIAMPLHQKPRTHAPLKQKTPLSLTRNHHLFYEIFLNADERPPCYAGGNRLSHYNFMQKSILRANHSQIFYHDLARKSAYS